MVHPEPNSGCWLWVGAITSSNMKKAYGWVDVQGSKLAHRYSCKLAMGNIPDDMKVLHKCDNHLCVNPDHLFIGTQKDNINDCVTKKRRAKLTGELHPKSKVTQEDVLHIRSYPQPAPFGTIKMLMDKYGLSRTQIKAIRSGKSWKS